mmetsp:Transcript_43232/g.101740  ORF Transcript_43232/g.101740 Transcript_43232/m.101740 type:complete len:937 (-) Transcript_43232:177-2987(-)
MSRFPTVLARRWTCLAAMSSLLAVVTLIRFLRITVGTAVRPVPATTVLARRGAILADVARAPTVEALCILLLARSRPAPLCRALLLLVFRLLAATLPDRRRNPGRSTGRGTTLDGGSKERHLGVLRGTALLTHLRGALVKQQHRLPVAAMQPRHHVDPTTSQVSHVGVVQRHPVARLLIPHHRHIVLIGERDHCAEGARRAAAHPLDDHAEVDFGDDGPDDGANLVLGRIGRRPADLNGEHRGQLRVEKLARHGISSHAVALGALARLGVAHGAEQRVESRARLLRLEDGREHACVEVEGERHVGPRLRSPAADAARRLHHLQCETSVRDTWGRHARSRRGDGEGLVDVVEHGPERLRGVAHLPALELGAVEDSPERLANRRSSQPLLDRPALGGGDEVVHELGQLADETQLTLRFTRVLVALELGVELLPHTPQPRQRLDDGVHPAEVVPLSVLEPNEAELLRWRRVVQSCTGRRSGAPWVLRREGLRAIRHLLRHCVWLRLALHGLRVGAVLRGLAWVPRHVLPRDGRTHAVRARVLHGWGWERRAVRADRPAIRTEKDTVSLSLGSGPLLLLLLHPKLVQHPLLLRGNLHHGRVVPSRPHHRGRKLRVVVELLDLGVHGAKADGLEVGGGAGVGHADRGGFERVAGTVARWRPLRPRRALARRRAVLGHSGVGIVGHGGVGHHGVHVRVVHHLRVGRGHAVGGRGGPVVQGGRVAWWWMHHEHRRSGHARWHVALHSASRSSSDRLGLVQHGLGRPVTHFRGGSGLSRSGLGLCRLSLHSDSRGSRCPRWFGRWLLLALLFASALVLFAVLGLRFVGCGLSGCCVGLAIGSKSSGRPSSEPCSSCRRGCRACGAHRLAGRVHRCIHNAEINGRRSRLRSRSRSDRGAGSHIGSGMRGGCGWGLLVLLALARLGVGRDCHLLVINDNRAVVDQQ